jgi:hypothetical protein
MAQYDTQFLVVIAAEQVFAPHQPLAPAILAASIATPRPSDLM